MDKIETENTDADSTSDGSDSHCINQNDVKDSICTKMDCVEKIKKEEIDTANDSCNSDGMQKKMEAETVDQVVSAKDQGTEESFGKEIVENTEKVEENTAESSVEAEGSVQSIKEEPVNNTEENVKTTEEINLDKDDHMVYREKQNLAADGSSDSSPDSDDEEDDSQVKNSEDTTAQINK